MYVVSFDDHERDCWRVFHFNNFRDYRGEIQPISVYIPFFDSILNGDEGKLRDLAEYVDDFLEVLDKYITYLFRYALSTY